MKIWIPFLIHVIRTAVYIEKHPPMQIKMHLN